MEQTPLDDLLNDEDDFSEPAIEDTTPEVPRDDHGRFAAKTSGVEDEAPASEPSEPPSDKLPPETFKGLREEREKRQALQAELEALKQQFQAVQNPPQAPAPPPSIWEDDQGALDHVKNEAITTAVQQANFNSKLDMSEMMVRQANADFDEVKADFLALAQQNPTLAQQALADPHPWNKAYQIAKNHKAMQELGSTNVTELEAKLREKIMAEMQATAPVMPNIPQSLTMARNVGQRSGPGWSGPRSLDDLLG